MSFQIIDGIPVWGEIQPNAIEQMKTVAKTAFKTALMADHHLGYAVPIGGVVAYKNAISPSGVGFDIGCGNKAVLTDMSGAELRTNIVKIMDDVFKIISFGVGRKNGEKVDHPLFEKDSHPGWDIPAIKSLKRMAADQLGTVGSGNHYVDLFTDELDRVWIGVHFGSRGLGHKTASYFLAQAGAKDGMMVEPCVLHTGTPLADDYIQGMELAGHYAYAGRNWVCDRVAKILGATILDSVHNHHNYAWQEEHFGENLWVVRKGATPAFPGQRGFVGGTMTEQAVILQGAERPRHTQSVFDPVEGIAPTDQELAMFSTVHGAGRVMGRKEATGVIKNVFDEATGKRTNEKRVVREPRVTDEMMADAVKAAGIELRGAGVDESPFCYKRLPDVLSAHSATVDILHTLTPVGVAMAGKHEFDPFKD